MEQDEDAVEIAERAGVDIGVGSMTARIVLSDLLYSTQSCQTRFETPNFAFDEELQSLALRGRTDRTWVTTTKVAM